MKVIRGGKAREGPGLWGTGYGVEVGGSIRKWVDFETYFFWHKHDSFAVAILRACLWFNQATMAVIILWPPYFFSALHSSRLESRLFYSRALQRPPIYRAAGFNSNGQSKDSRST
jgi:hypothetical protein